jgi:hypothetical protein
VDLQWGFPVAALDFYPLSEAFPMTVGNAFLHELGHARSLVDVYAWSITRSKDEVQLTPGPPRDQSGYYYASLQHGLMHFDWGHIDRYSAVVMNLMAGRRASRGNYNAPWNIGWFLNDLPATNRARFIRADGSAIANRTIRIYRPSAADGYSMTFDDREDFTLTTDGNGSVVLPRNVFSDGAIDRDPLNGVAIVEISDGSARRWAFLDSLQFNLAYWRGARDVAEHTIVADAPKCHDEIGPIEVKPAPEARVTTPEVRFEFPQRGYDLYYAIDGAAPVRVNVSGPTSLLLPPGHIVWWLVDASANGPCAAARSSIYAFDHDSAAPRRRRAVSK